MTTSDHEQADGVAELDVAPDVALIDRSLPMLDTSNLWDRVYTILKKKIILRHYPPEEKLSIADIAQQLNVSRTPVRDALNRLEMDGLVVTRSKVGTYIVPIDADLVNATMDTRLMIESWVVSKLDELPAETLQAGIAAMQKSHATALRTVAERPEKYHEYDFNLKFHLEFVGLTGNPLNVRIYHDLMSYSLPATTPSQVASGEIERATEQHGRILQALKDRDRAALEAAVRQHLDDSKRNILEKIERNGGKI